MSLSYHEGRGCCLPVSCRVTNAGNSAWHLVSVQHILSEWMEGLFLSSLLFHALATTTYSNHLDGFSPWKYRTAWENQWRSNLWLFQLSTRLRGQPTEIPSAAQPSPSCLSILSLAVLIWLAGPPAVPPWGNRVKELSRIHTPNHRKHNLLSVIQLLTTGSN